VGTVDYIILKNANEEAAGQVPQITEKQPFQPAVAGTEITVILQRNKIIRYICTTLVVLSVLGVSSELVEYMSSSNTCMSILDGVSCGSLFRLQYHVN
jgi:hypothetical protein